MKVDITARHFSPSRNLKKIICEKMEKILKFNVGIIRSRVILTKESTNIEKVEVIIHLKGKDFIAVESSDNFEKSLIIVIDKIITQVKKRHDRLIKH